MRSLTGMRGGGGVGVPLSHVHQRLEENRAPSIPHVRGDMAVNVAWFCWWCCCCCRYCYCAGAAADDADDADAVIVVAAVVAVFVSACRRCEPTAIRTQ